MKTLSNFIDRNKYNYKKQATVPEETINKYSNLFKGQFPEELIWIWKIWVLVYMKTVTYKL